MLCKTTTKTTELTLILADGALKSFKEVSQLDRSSEEKRTTAASLLNTILGGEHYDPAVDPLWMIDLTPGAPPPTADPIRRWLQQLQLKMQALVKPQGQSTSGKRTRKNSTSRSTYFLEVSNNPGLPRQATKKPLFTPKATRSFVYHKNFSLGRQD